MLKVEYPIDYLKEERGNSQVIDPSEEEQSVEQQSWRRKFTLKRLKRSDSDNNLQELETREPISIFQEITQEKDQSKKHNLEALLNKLRSSHSDDLKIGVALETGDCFFDSVAQGLNELKDKGLVENGERFNVKSLRKDCADYVEQHGEQDSWAYKVVIKDADIGGYFAALEGPYGFIQDPKTKINVIDEEKTFRKYLKDIKNVATGTDSPPIWGRLDIEGRVICDKYKVELYVYSIEEDSQKITVTKIAPGNNDPEVFIEGENLDQLKIDDTAKVARIISYKKHFVPLLSSLEKDIEKAIEVSREEVYGVENKKSSSLTQDTGNFGLEENNDQHVGNQVDGNINTQYQYNDHMILKVWDNFISKKGVKFYVGKNDDGGERYESSLFHGDGEMNLAIESGLLINNGREIYRNSGGYSVSMCQAVDYKNNSEATGENSISAPVKNALDQINLWNQQHKNEITKHKILFPYHSGPDHWVLGVIVLEYEQGILKGSELEIYDPLGTDSVRENVKSELEKVLNDNGGHIELKFIGKSKNQQNDGTSCGAITAENGKDVIEGKSGRLEKIYKDGAYELRERHVAEVNNARFTEIQRDSAVYETGKAEIFDNIDDIANNFHSFLNGLSVEDYSRFKNVLEKLKEYDPSNPGDSIKQDVKGILNEYKDKLKEFGVLDHFFTDGQEGLTWKDNSFDNLEYLVNEKNLFDPANRSDSSKANEQSESQAQYPKIAEQQLDLLGDRPKRADNKPQPGPSSQIGQDSQSLGQQTRTRSKKPGQELIEMFLSEITKEFDRRFEKLLNEVPSGHPAPSYDEFFIYFFLGSTITIPDRLIAKIGIKSVHFNLNFTDKGSKIIKLLFEINKDSQDRRLVLRTIIADGGNTLNDQYYSNDNIQEIVEKLNLAGDDANSYKVDARIFHITLNKDKGRVLKTSEDQKTKQYLEQALQKIQANVLEGVELQDKAKEFESIELQNKDDSSKFENALDNLSKKIDAVEEGVKKLFEGFIKVCKKNEKHFPKVAGRNKNDHNRYKESRFHGFIYGALVLNFKSKYYLDCYAERSSGRGGGADLVLISRKDGYKNRNLDAVPVIVELKVDQSASTTDVKKEVESNIFSNVRTFSGEAIVVCASLWIEKSNTMVQGSPDLRTERYDIPKVEGLITLLLEKLNDSDPYNIIKKELERLHHSIPSRGKINGNPHYLSRLILGEILTNNDKLRKFAFIYKGAEKFTTFLLQRDGVDQIIILNVVESVLNKKDENFESKFKLEKTITFNDKVVISDSVHIYQIDIGINPEQTKKFFDKKSSTEKYLQLLKIRKRNFQEYKNEQKYNGELIEFGSVNYVNFNKEGKLKVIENEQLTNNLNEALFPIKELITLVDGNQDLSKISDKKAGNIDKTTKSNLIAVIHGLFIGKQNIAKKSNQIIKVLAKTSLAYKHDLDLAISIASKDGKFYQENEVVAICTSEPDTLIERGLRSLIQKMRAKVQVVSFNVKANSKNDLINIKSKNYDIEHTSIGEEDIIEDFFDAIYEGKVNELEDLLNNRVTSEQIKLRKREYNDGFKLAVEREEFRMSDLLLQYSIDEGQRQLMLNGADKNGITFLDNAAENDKWNIVEYLINKGGKSDYALEPYMFRLIKEKEWEKVKFLIDKTVDVNAEDGKGMTALHYAVRDSDEKMVQFLIQKGADVNAEDKRENTPLHYACRNQDKDIRDLLIDNGARYITNKDNKGPEYYIIDEEFYRETDELFKKKFSNSDSQNPSSDEESYAPEEYHDSYDESDDSGARLNYRLNQSPDPGSDLTPSNSDESDSCLSINSSRRKREAIGEKCLFTWEDVDEFNEEKDEKRDFSKIKIDSEKFISYLKDLPKEKSSQLIQLADKVKVIGESQSLVNKLISNQKVMNHLGRVGKISGVTMHGMMAKNVLADFLNGNYQGVAINVGFIAGGQGFAKVAEVASLKGLNLLSEGKALLGSSLRAASPFLARGTSAFVIYDLVNQIKAFKNGTEEALVGVVGDSIYLGVDAAEIGIEVAEAFEVLEGVSSVTGPIGAAVGAVVFVGTDVYMAVKRVDKIDELIHLTGKEKFIEGLRAFIGMQPEKYIQELLQEKEVSNELVRQGLEYLNGHGDIQSYVFPTGKSVVDSCTKRTKTRYTLQAIPYEVTHEECTTKFEIDLDSTVLLDRKRTDIKWSRARPDDPSNGKLFCLPRGNDEPVPRYGSYLCENAIGLSTEKRENYTLINLGEGHDFSRGFLNSPNIFVVSNGFKKYYGGNKDDMFILQGDFIEGYINGGDGVNTVDLEKFAPEVRSIKVRLGRNGYISYINNNSSFGMENINRISGRRSKSDIITCDYNTKYVDGQGGESYTNPDVITVPSSSYFHEMNLIVRSNTNIVNHANTGSFNYTILPGRGKAQVNISLPSLLTGLPTDKHNFFFNSTIFDLIGVYIKNISQISNYAVKSATFSFLSDDNKLESEFDSRFDEGKFNITISDIPVNASYVLSNGAEIKMGNKGNMYMLKNTNKSAEEIIKNYLPLANRLNKMSFFIQSVLSNETVVIGSGNHEVIHNNPVYKSHLVGNGGENVYVIDSEIDNVPEVIIHDVDEENSIDTIDLRNVVKKAKELQVVKSENDLLLRATVEKHEYFTVRLKDGVERYNKTHVIVENAPMRISVDKNEWSLKPQPLMFEKDKEIIVVTDQDVEKGNELIIPRKGGNYTFVCSNSNDLMITNAFDSSITKDDLCSITLSRFYEIPKMKTLSIKFADKEIVLKDHEKEISAARNVEIVKREYKDQVYGDVFNHKSNVELLNAVKENNLNKVKELINQGIRIDVQDENIYGKKPIHIAAENNNKNIIKFLLSKGAKVTDTDRVGNTPLHYAAWRGCLEAAKFLVNKGANINAADTSTLGKKPIHVAAENNHKNIVEFLLSKGVSVDEVDRNDWTPLHWAASKGCLEVAKFLIERGSDINAENIYGKKPIHRAAENNNENIIELLLSKGISVNDIDKDGKTPLYWASWSGNLDIVKYLIGKGADINAKDKDGKTPLDVGIARKYDSIEKYLKQAQFNEQLLIAVKNNDVDKVKGLIENGASLEAKDENSKTPLHYFASEGNLDMCEFLANKGAKIEAKDLYGWTPLYYAIYKNNSGVLKFLLDKGADIEVKDINDETPLHIAAKDNNKPEVIRLLLDKGARIEAKNKDGWTPLHYAAYNDNVNVCKFLLERKANIEAKNKYDETPLHVAAENRNKSKVTVELLLDKGANINAKNKDGWVALHYAAYKDNVDVCKLLVERGASIKARDNGDRTALDVAKDKGNNDVVKCLEGKLKEEREKPAQRKRRHHHGDHNRCHLSHKPLAIDQSEMAVSSSTRPSSWINDLFGWVKSSMSGLLGSKATLPEISENYSNKSSTSQFSSEVCISNNVGLGFFLLQSFLDKKYPLPKFCSVTPEEALANTLNIVEEFEKTLEKTARQSDVLVKDVNFFKVYLDVAGHVRKERYSQIPNTLYSVAKEACPKNEKFLSILKGNIEKMFDEQQIVNSKYQANDIVDNKPRSYLNNTTVDKQLQESYYAISS